ncbi:MAG: type II toxin-antitoxin system RelE/ParE family toxin [Rhodanobacteraceae bacterium]|nr:type II toxin-antitoxin system RelE/ParE family toxin [Rhodanobacteraceae bacterium]
MKVYWSHEATRRLRELTAYIAKDSTQAAKQVAAGLLKRSRSLAAPPLLGRKVPEYPDSALREVLERPYRLIYQVTDRGIEIVTVMHYRQLLPEDPKQLSGSN